MVLLNLNMMKKKGCIPKNISPLVSAEEMSGVFTVLDVFVWL